MAHTPTGKPELVSVVCENLCITTATIGGVRPDGSTITINPSTGVISGANTYTLPIATTATIGGVRPDIHLHKDRCIYVYMERVFVSGRAGANTRWTSCPPLIVFLQKTITPHTFKLTFMTALRLKALNELKLTLMTALRLMALNVLKSFLTSQSCFS
jgi:hypothetical protein